MNSDHTEPVNGAPEPADTEPVNGAPEPADTAPAMPPASEAVPTPAPPMAADVPPAAPPIPAADATDYRVPDEPEPLASEGEPIAWMADSETHLEDVQPVAPPVEVVTGPLPVCDYTGDGDEPCEEPAVEKRWSNAAVVMSATVGALVGGLLVAAALVWSLGLLPGAAQPLRPEAVTPMNRPQQSVSIEPGRMMAEVSEAVASKVVPSVVNVTVQQSGVNPFTGQRINQDAGNGSGVIISKEGHILTNYHVIEGADRIVVTVGVEDKQAEVVGVDPSSDLAVLKIEGEDDFPAIDTGTSKGLKVGQYVMAVGSPFGLEKSVTVGIVSALNRSSQLPGVTDLTTYTNLIQTDAAINPGNSGGALVDAMGRLVGINTLIQSPSGAVGAPQSAGIGFAIPVDFAMDIARQLIESGRATHPYMGVSTETVDESVAEQFGLPVSSGALVRFVQPGSPAEAAGLERGDIVVKIDDRDITSVEDVFGAVRQRKIGDTVTVDVVRNDTTRTFEVVLASDAARQ